MVCLFKYYAMMGGSGGSDTEVGSSASFINEQVSLLWCLHICIKKEKLLYC